MLAQEYLWKAVICYRLVKQQGHQKLTIMVTNTNTILQERGKICYHAKGQLLDLDDQEEDCTNQVCTVQPLNDLRTVPS